MSGLRKVGMSAFMGGRGPHGNGAHSIESTRTGPLESVAGRGAGAFNAGGSGRTDTATLCGFRTHARRRALGPGRVAREPGDVAEVDDPGGLLAAAQPAGEKDPRVASAPGQCRGVGDAR